jgi:hypothetical protein
MAGVERKTRKVVHAKSCAISPDVQALDSQLRDALSAGGVARMSRPNRRNRGGVADQVPAFELG